MHLPATDADADLYVPPAVAVALAHAHVHLQDAHAEAVDSAGLPAKLHAAKSGPVGDDFSAANPGTGAKRDGERDQHVGSARRR